MRVRTHLGRPESSDGTSVLAFANGIGADPRNDSQGGEPLLLMETERLSAIVMLACSMSHDMRNSLSAVYANAEFLGSHDLCAGARADLLHEIQEGVHRMTERIDSLLHFVISGRTRSFTPVCVSGVLEKALAAVRSHPDGRKVAIAVGQCAPAEAEGDPKNLESAIYNLLLNACQAAARSSHVPEVKVHLAEADERICVTIADNGPGIPVTIRRTLFNPFVTAGKPHGTGLGLTLARRIAEEHGGSVSLVESNPGRTVFALSLAKNRSSARESPRCPASLR